MTVYASACIHVYMLMYIFMYVYACVYLYVYIWMVSFLSKLCIFFLFKFFMKHFNNVQR